MSHYGDAPHLGSSLSCVELLVASIFHHLDYDPIVLTNADRDRFILSKGHAATTLYAALALKNIIPESLLDTFNQDGSKLPEHPSLHSVPGVDAATGSLGHGLSIGAGMALGNKIKGSDHKVVVLLSDGECNEGSVWEAAMFAPSKNLNNLIALVDFNKWQATGRSEEVLHLSPLLQKWESFGWEGMEIDGNNIEEVLLAFEKSKISTKPFVIIGHTVKGKGISFMEDNNNWHYRIPSKEELEKAKEELKNTYAKCIC
jgi:transketolase